MAIRRGNAKTGPTIYRATRPDGRVHSLKSFEPNRVCQMQGCPTVLSVYNSHSYCWQHEPIHPYTLSVPGRRSRLRQAV